MSSKEKDQLNIAQSDSQLLSTNTDSTQQNLPFAGPGASQLELEEVLCRAGCIETVHK